MVLPPNFQLPLTSPSLLPIADLATMYTSQGRDALAEKTVASALDMARSTLPKDHWLIGKCMTHVAAVSTHQGEYDKAETMFIAALQLLRRSLPANHPELASGINQLGELYQVQQRFELAEYVSSTSPAHDLLHFAPPSVCCTT